MVVYIIIEYIIKTLIYTVLFLIVTVIGVRLWVEPFKARCKCKTKLNGKVALITGGNIGIGLETARGLAKRGAHIIIASRNEERSKQAVSDIIKTTGNPKVEYRHLDLSKFWSIRKFAEDFNKAFDRLDFLVNNSGAAGLKEDLNEYGIDPVTQINYLGPFLLTNLLLEKLIRSQPSRIVIVSSYAHKLHSFNINDIIGKRKLGIWKKYCNTKVYNVMWTKALAKRLPEGVTANCLHPGIVKTDIFHRLPKRMKDFLLSVISLMFKTPEEGAQTSIHLCVAPELAKVTGEYFSDCKISDPARITKKEEIVDQLWKESMLLVENKF